jgi:DNA-directed RNA polymerase specialized sigma24 family protein
MADDAPAGRFTAWVHRITRNVVAGMERKDQRDHAGTDHLTSDGIAAWLSHRSDALGLPAAADQLPAIPGGPLAAAALRCPAVVIAAY